MQKVRTGMNLTVRQHLMKQFAISSHFFSLDHCRICKSATKYRYKNNPFFLNSIYIMHFSKADTVIRVLVNALLMEVFGEVCEAVMVVCLHFYRNWSDRKMRLFPFS